MEINVRPVRVFLAEDHTPDVFLIKEALDSNGVVFDLCRYHNGEEALKALSDTPSSKVPDLIVLDLSLPRVSGFDLLRCVRSQAVLKGVPVAILTSSRAEEDREMAANLGANAFISKPPNLDDFIESVGGTLCSLLSRSGSRNPAARTGCPHRRHRSGLRRRATLGKSLGRDPHSAHKVAKQTHLY